MLAAADVFFTLGLIILLAGCWLGDGAGRRAMGYQPRPRRDETGMRCSQTSECRRELPDVRPGRYSRGGGREVPRFFLMNHFPRVKGELLVLLDMARAEYVAPIIPSEIEEQAAVLGCSKKIISLSVSDREKWHRLMNFKKIIR